MPVLTKQKRLIWISTGLIVVTSMLLYGLVLINETAGGLSDWRMSHSMGLNGTIRIPLGKNPEEAVQQFRHYPSFDVVHREPVKGGILLFIKRDYQQESTNLQVEYVRKAWLGWKWAWGGGYGMGVNKSPVQAKSALTYMSMPKVEHISTPFPMVFGEVLDPSIKSVSVNFKNNKYKAKLTGVENGHTIWFVFLPSADSFSIEIEGLNDKGDRIASQTSNDPTDSGLIELMN